MNYEQRRSKNKENRTIPSSKTYQRPTVTFNDTVTVATIIHDSSQSVLTTDAQLNDKRTAQPITRRSLAPKRTSDSKLVTVLKT